MSTHVCWLVVRTTSRFWISFLLAAGVMTETAGSTASCSSMTMREWFEDSSSEGEAPIRVRLMKNGGKKKSTSSMSLKKERKRKVELDKEKKVEQMREIRVVVKLELKNFTSSKGTLTAHVACGFSKSDGLSATSR